ncbi:MAG: response regulator transcription factor [Myxococcota bacterium]
MTERATNELAIDSRILVIEDEEHLAAGLKLNLELDGHAVDVAGTAKEAAQLLLCPDRYQLLVLDVMLPDVSGFELCSKLRESGNYVPVVMLTARDAPEDRVCGLEAGADDYLVKPFALDELLARIRSCLRRQAWAKNPEQTKETATFAFGQNIVNFATHEVKRGEESLRLTQLEFDLLRYFVDHPDRVIRRDELLEKVWKLRNYASARTVDNFISRLRRHFEEEPSTPVHFVSVRGAGYRFLP